MNKSLSRILRKSTIHIVAVLALIAVAPISQAESAPQLDKHARKIEKRLAKFQPGTYLDFEFRDSSQTFGSLGEMSDASFQFTDADSNKTETHRYADVASVRKAKEYIGEGSGHGRHVRLLVPLLIGAGAAAAGIATYEAVR
ncbi:MAG: hypothetical protein ABSB50_14025 [Terracidiphilus sp.]|jgi:polyisoprenoid-binding protein YceI